MKQAKAIRIEGDLGNPIDGIKILDFETSTMLDTVNRADIEIRAGERTKATLYHLDGRVEWCYVECRPEHKS